MTGEELKARRQALGYSQDKLAKKLGVTTSTLARWEQGVLNIGNPDMLNLALNSIETQESQSKTAKTKKKIKSK